MESPVYFSETEGCPFCAVRSDDVIDEVSYYATAEASRKLPDVKGKLFACDSCSVAYPSHVYALDSFPLLYDKSLQDLRYFDASLLQTLRMGFLRLVLRAHHRERSLSRLLDRLSLRVFQVP